MSNGYRVRILAAADVDAYVDHLVVHNRESGTEGELPYGPYSREEPEDPVEMRAKALRRWDTALDKTGWRRAWGLFDARGDIVGSVHLAGGDLPATLHRSDCGIGIARPHRGNGFGRGLMEAAIEWARAQPSIDWIELGVFEGNDRAAALYDSLGFTRCGRTPDMFRVDGHVLNDIRMVLQVGGTSALLPS